MSYQDELTNMIAKLKEKDFDGAAEILSPIIEKKAADIISAQFNGPSIVKEKINNITIEDDEHEVT